MRLWFLVKLIAFLAVAGVMAFTGMLAYHVLVQPLGGIFEKIVPNPTQIVRGEADTDFAKMLDSAELPDIDPGEKAFQKAHELLALDQYTEAREKLTAIVNVFPTSPSAPIARRIVGDMNMDEVLSTSFKDGKQTHVVKRGDSFLRIAAKYKTTLDMILYLNGMFEFGGIQPGDELIVMPLEFRLLIEPQRKSISVWNGGKFLREYPIIRIDGGGSLPGTKTTIESKAGLVDGKRVQPMAKGYRSAPKTIQLAKIPVPIVADVPGDEDPPNGIFLSIPDVEELNLLTRAGNEVEIRNPKR
jgi:hypothetical protein